MSTPLASASLLESPRASTISSSPLSIPLIHIQEHSSLAERSPSTSTSSSPFAIPLLHIQEHSNTPSSHSSSPSYPSTPDSSSCNSASSSPSSVKRSSSFRKSLNLSSLSSVLMRSPQSQRSVHSSTSVSASGAQQQPQGSLILTVQVPVLGRKKKISFNGAESVKDALKVIQEKFEIADSEMDLYDIFIPVRGKYCKRDRPISSYRLKDNDEVLLKERRSSLLVRGSKEETNREKGENSYIVRVALPVSFTRSAKPQLFRHLATSASVSGSASPASSVSHSPAQSPSTSIASSPAQSPMPSPGASPIVRRRSLSNSSSALSLMSVGRALTRSRLSTKSVHRNSLGLNTPDGQESSQYAGLFIDEFVCDFGHTAHDIIKKVEERYPLVDRDTLDDFSLYKDGIWLDRRKTFDWYKITPQDVLVFKPLWIRLDLELDGRNITIKVLPTFTIRTVKTRIKQFSMARYHTSSSTTATPPSTSVHTPPVTPSSSSTESRATWDFTAPASTPLLKRESSGKSILEVQPAEKDSEDAPVEGFTIEETRAYFAQYQASLFERFKFCDFERYQQFELFLMPISNSTIPQGTVIGMLLDEDRDVASFRLQRSMKLSFRKHDEFTKRHFKTPQLSDPSRYAKSSSPSYLSPLAALFGYPDDRIYVVVNSVEHKICQLFDFDKEVTIRQVIETFLQSVQTRAGIKENPDRYSINLNTNELVGDSDSESNLVHLDSTKNLSLYPLKDMDCLELRRTISVFGITPAEFELKEDNGYEVPYFLATIRSELGQRGFEKEGIFRVAGSDSTMTSLSRQFFYNSYTSCEDMYSLASFVKRWYMRLPQRLLSRMSAEDVERVSSEPVEVMRESLNRKFSDKFDLFWWLIGLGANIAEKQELNKMNPKNIGIVFGALCYETEILHIHQKVISIVQALIEDKVKSPASPIPLRQQKVSSKSRLHF